MNQNPMSLTGRHILITGASAGIGRATAIAAAQLGARVSLLARRTKELHETLAMLAGQDHAVFSRDLSMTGEIEGIVKDVIGQMGPLDGLAHCAGHGKNRPLAMTSPAFVMESMAVSYNAFVELLRCIGKKRHVNDRASLVGVSSVAALRGDKAQGAYAAAKAAMNAIVPPAAKELAPRGIRVNAVAFGMIRTEMYQAFKDSGGLDAVLGSQYLGVAEPEDAANVLCFLLSDASKFITGTVLVADGGYLS